MTPKRISTAADVDMGRILRATWAIQHVSKKRYWLVVNGKVVGHEVDRCAQRDTTPPIFAKISSTKADNQIKPTNTTQSTLSRNQPRKFSLREGMLVNRTGESKTVQPQFIENCE